MVVDEIDVEGVTVFKPKMSRQFPMLSRRKPPEMPCLSSCTLHFVAPMLEFAHGQWNTQAAFRGHRAHTTFMPVCRQAMHEVPCLSA